MITRADIEAEAAFVQRLTNPTGGKHTPTPWRAHDNDAVGLHAIQDGNGDPVAMFKRRDDRDLALYFANTHAAIIGMLRGEAGAWDFARGATYDAGLQSYAATHAENLRTYADLFCRLGTPDPMGETQGSA